MLTRNCSRLKSGALSTSIAFVAILVTTALLPGEVEAAKTKFETEIEVETDTLAVPVSLDAFARNVACAALASGIEGSLELEVENVGGVGVTVRIEVTPAGGDFERLLSRSLPNLEYEAQQAVQSGPPGETITIKVVGKK